MCYFITMRKVFLIASLLALIAVLSAGIAQARVVDKVVAFVDDYAITLRELDAAVERASTRQRQLTRSDVLEAMIDHYLLLREARRAHLDYDDEDKAISEYLSIKIRSAIRIREDNIREYYNTNLIDYRGRSYDQARDEIEDLMIEKEFQVKLKIQLKELRDWSRIKILGQ